MASRIGSMLCSFSETQALMSADLNAAAEPVLALPLNGERRC